MYETKNKKNEVCPLCSTHDDSDISYQYCPIFDQAICFGCHIEISDWAEEGTEFLDTIIETIKYLEKRNKEKVNKEDLRKICKSCPTFPKIVEIYSPLSH